MMYHACSKPGTKPSMQSKMLMRESAEQIPVFTQTVGGHFSFVHGKSVRREIQGEKRDQENTYLRWEETRWPKDRGRYLKSTFSPSYHTKDLYLALT